MRLTKARLKQIIKEEIGSLTYDDELGTTEPRYDVEEGPEARLLRQLFMRQKIDRMSQEEIESLSGGDEEVAELIRKLQGDQMLDNPRM
jgi:ABC-type hemin transport system ATPase subunit